MTRIEGVSRRGFLQALALSAASLALLPLVSACSETENTGEDDSSDFNELPMQPGVGSILEIGGYSWEVIGVGDHQALLVTEHVIALRAYTSWREGATDDPKFSAMALSECDLAKWLNNEFLVSFSEKELSRIIPTALDDKPEEYRVFCLSREAIKKYMPTMESRIATLNLTEAAMEDFYDRFAASMNPLDSEVEQIRVKISREQGKPHSWWIRFTSGGNEALFSQGYREGAVVDENGNMDGYAYYSDEEIGARPALWLSVG